MLRSFLWESTVNIANMFENVIFITHEDVTMTKNKFGREVSNFSPVYEEKLKDKLMGIMAICGRTLKDVDENGLPSYRLHIGHRDDEFGGTRLGIENTDIELTYEAFMNNFKKKLTTTSTASTVTANPNTVTANPTTVTNTSSVIGKATTPRVNK